MFDSMPIVIIEKKKSLDKIFFYSLVLMSPPRSQLSLSHFSRSNILKFPSFFLLYPQTPYFHEDRMS